MNYTIVSCITKYGINDIKPFVESINKSGYNGEKIMIVYETTNEVIEYLTNNQWTVLQSELQEHIILQRFRDIYYLLHQHETDIVICLDVKDVIFQTNPIEWIESNMKKDILALSESIIIGDDDWAQLNSGTSFPLEWQWVQYKESYCAGTIIGKKDAIRDLFIDIKTLQ